MTKKNKKKNVPTHKVRKVLNKLADIRKKENPTTSHRKGVEL